MFPRLLLTFCLLAAACLCSYANAAHIEFTVAPGGTDKNPGTKERPFATIARARDAVRSQIAKGLNRDVLVQIRGGVYRQPDTLTFGPQDSGTAEHSVTYAAYPGEKVVISGGRPITGWKRGPGDLWTTRLADVKAGRWYFRQLFVNGRRATRARTPNADDPMPWWKIKSVAMQGSGTEKTATLSVDHPIQAWENPADIEFVFLFNNDGSRKRLGAIDEAAQTFTLPPPSDWFPMSLEWWQRIGNPGAGHAAYFENALEFLDEPGEWYLDRATGILTYWPRPGEDMTRVNIVAPVRQGTLVSVAGTDTHHITNLHFRGLEVAYVDYELPPRGFVGLFGCLQRSYQNPDDQKSPFNQYFIDPAVQLRSAWNCSFTDGVVAHVGGMGMTVDQICSHVTIEGNRFYDIGGNGLVVSGGGVDRDDPRATQPMSYGPGEYRYYRISNNLIHDCGLDYFGGLGIFTTLIGDSVISHNEIHDISYAGINVGGNADSGLKFPMNNTYEYNHVYHVMKTAVDGAGLYFGPTYLPVSGPVGVIRGNWVHDNTRNIYNAREPGTFSCPGIYLDGISPQYGVKGWAFEDNVVYHVGPAQIIFNQCDQKDQTFHNNYFNDAPPPEEVLEKARATAGLEPAYRHLRTDAE